VNFARRTINNESVGNYMRLDEEQHSVIESIAGKTLDRWGYQDIHSVAA
jgi:hypothetical protein